MQRTNFFIFISSSASAADYSISQSNQRFYHVLPTDKTQRFKELECQKRFTANFGFKTCIDQSIITCSMQIYFTGMNVRDISNHYEMFAHLSKSYCFNFNIFDTVSKRKELIVNEDIVITKDSDSK